MLKQLARALEAADAAAMAETMGDDITLRVAVHDEPFEGRPAAAQILGAVLDGVLYDIKVTETIDGHDTAVLMFSAQVAGYRGQVDGLLVVRSGGSGRMSDLTVFLRPLGALQALGDEMGRRMGGPRPEGSA
jgi:hypothetical protein